METKEITKFKVIEASNTRMRFRSTVSSIDMAELIALNGSAFVLFTDARRIDDGSWEVTYTFEPAAQYMSVVATTDPSIDG